MKQQLLTFKPLLTDLKYCCDIYVIYQGSEKISKQIQQFTFSVFRYKLSINQKNLLHSALITLQK